jgi:hypothetical protein
VVIVMPGIVTVRSTVVLTIVLVHLRACAELLAKLVTLRRIHSHVGNY